MMFRSSLLLLVSSLCSASYTMCTLHVDLNFGNDTNNGTTTETSLKSLHEALLRLRLSTFQQKHHVVCIGPGVYREQLHLDENTAYGTSVTWIAREGLGTVVVSGAVPVVLIPLAQDDPARLILPPSIANEALVTSLPAAGLPIGSYGDIPAAGGFEWGCLQPFPSQLLVDDILQDWARWPNADSDSYGGNWAYTQPIELPSLFGETLSWFIGGIDNNGNGTGIFPPSLWRDTSNVYMHSYPFWDWSDNWLRVKPGGIGPSNVSTGSSNITLLPPFPPHNITIGARFYLVGSLDAFDSPGESYLNVSSGSLYWLPTTTTTVWNTRTVNESSKSFAASVTNITTPLVNGTNLSGHTFIGLSFSGTRGAAFTCENCTNVSIINCTFTAIGTSAVLFTESNNCTVNGATISGIGARGVSFIGGGDRNTLTSSGNIILNSNVTRFQQRCFTYEPGVTIDTGGEILHNEISHSPHAGLSLSGNDVKIRWNIVHHTVQDTFDSAALYWFPGDWSKFGVEVTDNLWYLNGEHSSTTNRNTQPFRASVYMDNAGGGLLVERNVIWQPPMTSILCRLCTDIAYFSVGINNDGGIASNFTSNIIIDVNGTYNSGGMLTWDVSGQINSSSYFNGLRAVQWNKGIYAQAYPDLALRDDYFISRANCSSDWHCPSAPWNNSFTSNVLVNASGVARFPPSDTLFNSSNFNISFNLVNEDPHFVSSDPRGTLNFQLRDDSPAYLLGFQKIHMECFGLWKCS
jgi:hypothetical protein